MTKPHFKLPVEAIGEGICDADGIWVLIPAKNRFSLRQNIDHAKLTAHALNCHDELVAACEDVSEILPADQCADVLGSDLALRLKSILAKAKGGGK